MAVLVTGGAGYIGSHTVAEFMAKGEEVIVLDNLQKGHREAVLTETFYQGDIRDTELLERVFINHDIEAVIHFAADSLVGESVQEPLKYYDNNLITAQRLLVCMVKYGVRKIVFSSTAATYGEPENIPIRETDRKEPTNPYGETKLAIETMLRWCEQAYGTQSVALRYFNAAGAHIDGHIGEDHRPESHLIPIILQVAGGQRKDLAIYGDDYPTADGTCIRDYIHVTDLANAHWLALQKLRQTEGSAAYNLGNGEGFSVREVLEKAREITGHSIPMQIAPRRVGDPAILVASSIRAQEELGWKPEFNSLGQIIQSAWNWHKNHPNGFVK
ncbi:UDP-glucose 4-epimerase GalE [Desulfosporosinus sp. BICA1-9]|uniref:UDP-glucose 4-epimerase GalE n=1 Tax=Desulfosporosinus sp. BICA1-9 TaxID=1531958 RepID=UPI00054B590D|nr:UDP-glucose 4-epimerase GalE [Desulfosporosinus sp. BICA1-9]KJS46332.1 MAG: UDP-glucose 4-epimerase [Peptococcaceae bacterium BRH_c23]KJS90685.1 MAG: UDP-glucose 4-epimerase [Desulfosporosinus sp. BICA1-9]HBW34930.1 UDP-glucose 4-epimerase GalE [Desulfosporosinus sp.]